MSDWMKLRRWLRGPATPAPAPAPARRTARLGFDVLEDRVVPAANSDFRGLIGLDALQASYAYRGAGYSVAVLDTGINYNDPNLGGGWGKRVVAGWNFIANNNNPMDDNGHGTFVAGEIGSSSTLYPGVAPGANPTPYGLLAEQVAHSPPALSQHAPNGQPAGVYYQELPALLLAQLKHQHQQDDQKFQRQQAQLQRQARELRWLRHEVLKHH